jgi:cyclic pyranopterin phosphate synthase
MGKLTHVDSEGNAAMVDVSGKDSTKRKALAEAMVNLSPRVHQAILDDAVSKGDVLGVARIAGVQAAKRTHELIPLCHPLLLEHVEISFEHDRDNNLINVLCAVTCSGKTGVEMEALSGAAMAALTIYDMCKGLERGIEITGLRLISKEGGKSGCYHCGTDDQ